MKTTMVGLATAVLVVAMACDVPTPEEIAGPVAEARSAVDLAEGATPGEAGVANEQELQEGAARLAGAIAADVVGAVIMEAIVASDGKVRGVVVLDDDVPDAMRDGAVDLASRVRFHPFTVEGRRKVLMQPLWVRFDGGSAKLQLLRNPEDNTLSKADVVRRIEQGFVRLPSALLRGTALRWSFRTTTEGTGATTRTESVRLDGESSTFEFSEAPAEHQARWTPIDRPGQAVPSPTWRARASVDLSFTASSSALDAPGHEFGRFRVREDPSANR